MYQQVNQYLQQIQQVMEELNLWQTQPPAREAFASEQPFALDTMSPEQWLQWVFVPKMQALIEGNLPLPKRIAICPYLEQSLEELNELPKLLTPIQQLEQLLTES